ncbi:hypothetical protein ACFLTP_01795 [Chloroflexota bacterium]
MDTSDIISSILAGLTFLGIIVALGLGLWSILETRKLKIIQYREIFIDNLLDWLLDITECESKDNISNFVESQQVDQDAVIAKTHYSIVAGNRGNEYRRLINRGIILVNTFRDKEKFLPKTISKLNEELQTLANANDKYRISFSDLIALPTEIPKVTALLKSYKDEVGKVLKNNIKLRETIFKDAIKLKYAKSFL